MAFDLKAEIYKIQRVLAVSTRPRSREFWHMARVTAMGTVAIGLSGIIIFEILKSLDWFISFIAGK